MDRLAKNPLLGHMCPMPKGRHTKNNLTRVREGIGLSQLEFARRLGVLVSIIKKVEAGERPASSDLAARVFAETGVLLTSRSEEAPIEYTKAKYAAWKRQVRLDQQSVREAGRVIMRHVELVMAASARPGVEKFSAVFHGLVQAVERVKKEFKLEEPIEAELRQRQKTGFKGDSKLKGQEPVRLSKPAGWLPAKELCDLVVPHLEFIKAIGAVDESKLTGAQKARLAQIKKQLRRETNTLLHL